MRDFDRPLSHRGQRDAPRIGDFLAEHIEPDRVLVSPALRTRQTWDLVAERLHGQPDVDYAPELYHGAPHGMLDLIREQDDAYAAIMLVAHNPGTEDLAQNLSGSGNADALSRMAGKYPTAGLAEIRVDCASWDTLEWGEGELLSFVVPGDLP